MRPHWVAFLVLLAIAVAAPTAFANGISCYTITGNLVLNCGFETLPASGNVPPDWTAAQFTSFEAIVTSPVDTGTYAMRIANDEFQSGEPLFNGAAILSQSFSDILGATYTFSFYLYNGDPGGAQEQFQAFWGTSASPTSGSPVFVDTGSAPTAWTQESFQVTGSGSDTITFTSYNTPSFYYLDDVSVSAGSVVPEPGTASLLLIGFGSLGLIVVMRKRIAGGLSQVS